MYGLQRKRINRFKMFQAIRAASFFLQAMYDVQNYNYFFVKLHFGGFFSSVSSFSSKFLAKSDK